AAPVCEGPYRRIPLWDDGATNETFSPADPLPERKRRAYGHYLSAYAAWAKNRDARAAASELESAVRGDEEDPIYRHMRGLTALMTGEFDTARDNFEGGAG